jgi:hypothetical protein
LAERGVRIEAPRHATDDFRGEPVKGELNTPTRLSRHPLGPANAPCPTHCGREGLCLTRFDRHVPQAGTPPVAPSDHVSSNVPIGDADTVSAGWRPGRSPSGRVVSSGDGKHCFARDIGGTIVQQFWDVQVRTSGFTERSDPPAKSRAARAPKGGSRRTKETEKETI